MSLSSRISAVVSRIAAEIKGLPRIIIRSGTTPPGDVTAPEGSLYLGFDPVASIYFRGLYRRLASSWAAMTIDGGLVTLAAETQRGVVLRATPEQVDAATDASRYMTPFLTKRAIEQHTPPATLFTGGVVPPTNFGPEPQDSFYIHTDDNRVVGFYRKSGDYWEEQLWADDSLAPASTVERGGVVRATQAEVTAGTNTDKYVTPQTLKGAISSGSLRGPQVFTGTTNPTSTSGYVTGDVFINTATGQLWVNE